MSVLYQRVPPFPFYSLREFTQLQPLIKNKTTIYLYQHNSSQEIFAVKQIPYSQKILKIYKILLKRQSLESMVRLRGMCMMVIKYGVKKGLLSKYQQNQEERKKQNSELEILEGQKNRKKCVKSYHKSVKSLLLFMEKCQCDLVELIRFRRNQRKPFHPEEIRNFIREVLFLLETLEKDGVSHRDIKPQNFLYDHGRFRLCDFQSAIHVGEQNQIPEQQIFQLDLTTLEYTSPQFYKNLKNPKNKIFDPFKLDVYALGITLLYMCSMGKFDLYQRKQYLLEDSVFHNEYVKQERRKILKNKDQYKQFNTIVKNMLEEDEYKRDTFRTLVMKMNPIMNIKNAAIDVLQLAEIVSDQARSEQSRKQIVRGGGLSKKRRTRGSLWPGSSQTHRKCLLSLLMFGFSFFILILIV